MNKSLPYIRDDSIFSIFWCFLLFGILQLVRVMAFRFLFSLFFLPYRFFVPYFLVFVINYTTSTFFQCVEKSWVSFEILSVPVYRVFRFIRSLLRFSASLALYRLYGEVSRRTVTPLTTSFSFPFFISCPSLPAWCLFPGRYWRYQCFLLDGHVWRKTWKHKILSWNGCVFSDKCAGVFSFSNPSDVVLAYISTDHADAGGKHFLLCSILY